MKIPDSAYPLTWPVTWPRVRWRKGAQFFSQTHKASVFDASETITGRRDKSMAEATTLLFKELEMLGETSLVLDCKKIPKDFTITHHNGYPVHMAVLEKAKK
jgi:hypothetical protein